MSGSYYPPKGVHPDAGAYEQPRFSPAQLRYFQWNFERRSLQKLGGAFLACVILHYICMFLTGLGVELLLWACYRQLWGDLAANLIEQVYPLLFYFTSIMLPFSFFRRIGGNPPAPMLENKLSLPVTLSATGVSLGISVFGLLASSLLLTLFSTIGLAPPDLTLPQATDWFGHAMSFVGIVILPCIIEEIIFRQAILGALQPYGNWFAIITSAVLFGLYHGNMAQLPYSFMLGICLGYFVLKTQSVYTGMFIHFVNNLLAWLGNLISQNMSEDAFSLLYMGEWGARLLFAVAGLIFLGAVRGVQWKMPRGKTIIQGKDAARTFFWSIPVVVVMIIYGVQIFLSFS